MLQNCRYLLQRQIIITDVFLNIIISVAKFLLMDDFFSFYDNLFQKNL